MLDTLSIKVLLDHNKENILQTLAVIRILPEVAKSLVSNIIKQNMTCTGTFGINLYTFGKCKPNCMHLQNNFC